MATPIPQARVVRRSGSRGGQNFTPPSEPPRPRGPIAQQLYTLLGVAIGMWPLTAVVLVLLGLLVMAGNNASIRP